MIMHSAGGALEQRRTTASRYIDVAFDMTFPNRNAGGTGVYARSLLSALAKGHEIVIREISAPEGAGTRGTLKWLTAGANRSVLRSRADLLHCPAFIAPWRCPVPLVVTIYDSAGLLFPADYPLEWRLYNRFFLPALARSAAQVITLTEFARRDIGRHYKVPLRRIAVTHAAPQPQYTPRSSPERMAYRDLLPGNDVPLLLFAGAPVSRKNLDLVLAGLENAEDTSLLARSRLLISGARAEDFPQYRDRIAACKLATKVSWLGQLPQEEMPLLYSAVDALVYPSTYEGFGLPPLEAMAVGTPVVASNATCLPEVLGDSALLVDPHDEHAFAAATEAVLTRPELRAKLVEAGLKQAAKYTWEKCAAETARVYRRVVSSR